MALYTGMKKKLMHFGFVPVYLCQKKYTDFCIFHIVAVSEMNKIQEAVDLNSLHIYFTN